MCLRPRKVYTVCSHTDELSQEDCTQVQIIKAAQKLGGFFVPLCLRSSRAPTWAQPICVTRVDYRLEYDFCPACRAVFAAHGELNEAVILRYWAYKNNHGMRRPVDPVVIRPDILFVPANGTAADPRDLRMETIALSEALHMWDSPEEFKSSRAYANGDGPLNLVEYLEEIRSTTLHRAGRGDHVRRPLPVPPGPRIANASAGDSEMATIRQKCGPVARIPVPCRPQISTTEGLSTTARATTDTSQAASTMVYEPDSDVEESPKRPRSPKGKEKAIDSPPPREFHFPGAANSQRQEWANARRQRYLDRTFSGEAGPSNWATAFPFDQSSSTASSDKISMASDDHSAILSQGTVARKPVLVIPTRLPGGTNAASLQRVTSAQSYPGPAVIVLPVASPARSMVGVIETVSDSGSYHSDFEEYDSDLSPRKHPVAKWYDGADDVSSQGSSPLVSPASPGLRNVVADDPFTDGGFSQEPDPSPNAPLDIGRSDTNPGDATALPPTPNTSILPSTTTRSADHRSSDRPDSEVIPAASSPFTRRPLPALPALPSDQPSHESFPGASADGNDASIPDTPRPLPVPPVPPVPRTDNGNGDLPGVLARAMADIGALLQQPQVPGDRNDGYIPYRPAGATPAPLSAFSIAAAAARQRPLALRRTAYVSPLPLAPPRVGTPSLATTPSPDLRSMYVSAIAAGRCVLSTTPPPTAAHHARGGDRRRRSAVGLVLSAVPRLELEADLAEARERERAPRSAPPFPARWEGRGFDELAGRPVCFCAEMGKFGCACPAGVEEPVVWV